VAEGRIEEAAGALTGNDDLREEGRTDQAAGHAKVAVQKAVRKIKKVALKTIERAEGAAE
jgi:uncharacterized protein YjbJ (UPF0337 family)